LPEVSSVGTSYYAGTEWLPMAVLAVLGLVLFEDYVQKYVIVMHKRDACHFVA
jgi:hypothetical protein